MTKQSDPVFAGLAEGLRPADTPADTFSGASLLDLLSQNGFWRVLHAAERSAEAAERQVHETKNWTDATERVANALETIAALFASTIGVGTAACGGWPDSPTYETVNFIRSGLGRKDFVCDGDSIEATKDD